MLDELTFVIKFTFKVPVSYIINDCCNGHFASVRFTEYSEVLINNDVTNLVITTSTEEF